MKLDRKSLIHAIGRPIRWSDSHLPTGVRAVVGVPVIIGGCLGFLPILGFWMVPLGLALVALDIPPWRRRVIGWLDRHDAADTRKTTSSTAPRSGRS